VLSRQVTRGFWVTNDEKRLEVVIPLVEESLIVQRRTVETGRVQVHLTTETREEAVEYDLRSDRVTVERVPVGRVIYEIPEVREVDGTTIIPVVEEVLVKQLRLVEEIHLRRLVQTTRTSEPEQLRRQTATVTRTPPRPADPSN